MAQHFTEADADGNFSVWYDDPKEAPNYGEKSEAVESRSDSKGLWLRQLPECIDFSKTTEIVGFLMGRAGEVLPAGTTFEIRAKIPSDYGRAKGLCWYTTAAMQSLPLEGFIAYPGRANELGGYCYLGRFRT